MPRASVEGKVAPPPESPAHQRLLDLVRSRRSLSVKKMSDYYPEWTKADRIYSHYVEPGEVDSQGKRLYPWARSIVVPMSYAIVQTQLSWEMAAFTQRVPIVPLDGLSPEDVKPAKVMEQVLQHEWSTDRMSLALYQWLLDRRRYGVGIVWINWARDATRQRVEVQRTLPLSFLGIELPIGTQWEWQDRIKYEGNRLEPIDPFRFYPDPRVSLADSHRGEFVGFRTQRHYHELLLLERDGQYANVKRLPKRPSQGGLTSQASTPMEPRSLDRSSVGLGDWMGQIGPNTRGLPGARLRHPRRLRHPHRAEGLPALRLLLAPEVRRRRRQRGDHPPCPAVRVRPRRAARVRHGAERGPAPVQYAGCRESPRRSTGLS